MCGKQAPSQQDWLGDLRIVDSAIELATDCCYKKGNHG
jgi:hypothetical protein